MLGAFGSVTKAPVLVNTDRTSTGVKKEPLMDFAALCKQAAAPAAQWNAIQPTFQHIINSFNFTEQAVLRPTDATPPPTPTPTPTPMIYIVQSGDTLLGIALEFGVDVDILAARNGIEVPENLRTGQKLIIPIKSKF